MEKQEVLSLLSFGQRVAEEEVDQLTRYFVETDNWRRLFSGDIDIVYGPKGSGKSALYALLLSRRDELFDRSIILLSGENPRGAPAFRDLVTDPPTTERQFIALWKLFFAALIAETFEEYGIGGPHASELRTSLEREGLLRRERTLRGILRAALDYVKRAIRPPESISAGVEIDSASGLPTGFEGRITFQEPSTSAAGQGFHSIDHLLELANRALGQANFSVWVLLDRLDVAFVENSDLEQNALRALFHVYQDMAGLLSVRIKIFLRTDIWRRITVSGFREASHITRHMTISWDRRTLLNLIVSRAVQNPALLEFYEVDSRVVLSSHEAQRDLFYRIFPAQVDVGPNKPETFDWILSRTTDGTRQTAPREVIHLLNSLREIQIRRLETGDVEPDGRELFVRASFKEALSDVSRARLEQTLYAEYPQLRTNLEALKGGKTSHRVETLSAVWGVPLDKAQEIAQSLVEVGFFEKRGTRESPEYWVPFIYRDALDLVQGSAGLQGQ